MVLVAFNGGPLDTRAISYGNHAKPLDIRLESDDSGYYAFDKQSHTFIWTLNDVVHIRPATQHTTTK